MNKTLIFASIITLLLTAVAPGGQTAVSATAPSQPAQADDQPIRLAGDAFVKAYNAGDAKAVAALFLADGEIVNQARKSVQGQKAVEQVFGRCFQNHPKSKIKVSIESIRLLGPTTAVEDGTSTVTAPSGQVIEQNRYMVVYVKQDGAWRMATARDLPNQQAASSEEMKGLHWLIGNWVDESPGTTVTTAYRPSEDGRVILSEFHVQIGGKPAMNGMQRISWDPHTGKLHSWVHDSEGGFAEGVWTRNGNQWIVKTSGVTHDGQPASATNVLTHVAKDRMTWQSRDRVVGDEVVPNIEPIVVVRKAPTPQ
jgi:uncharacterized protein (TIGR02246 family)